MITIKLKDTYSIDPNLEMDGSDTVFRISGDKLYAICYKDYDQFCNLLDISKDDFENSFAEMFANSGLDYNVSYNLNSLVGIIEHAYSIKLPSQYVYILSFMCEHAYGITNEEETKNLFEIDYKNFTFKLTTPLRYNIVDVQFIFPVATDNGGTTVECQLKDLNKICVPAIDSKMVIFIYNQKFYFVLRANQLISDFVKKGTAGGYFTGDINFVEDYLVDILKLLPLNVPIKIDSIRNLMDIKLKERLLDVGNGGAGIEKLDGGIKLTDREFITILQLLKIKLVGDKPDEQENPSLYQGMKAFDITIDHITLEYFITVFVDTNDPYTIIKEQ